MDNEPRYIYDFGENYRTKFSISEEQTFIAIHQRKQALDDDICLTGTVFLLVDGDRNLCRQKSLKSNLLYPNN
jgi:hypothetical protein